MSEPHLLLIGGGHAHVAVLADWIKRGRPARATVLTPYPTLRYSGMVPGWIAGEHGRGDGLVDLAGLAERAGAKLVLDRCAGLEPDQRIARTERGDDIAFDIASIDTGGVGRARAVLGDDPRLLDVRPIDTFVDGINLWRGQPSSEPRQVAIVGGGAGGVELAFGLRNTSGTEPRPEVTLVAGDEGLLPEFGSAISARVRAELRTQDIHLVEANARIEHGVLVADGKSIEPVGLIVAALGSAAPDWPRASGLACDTDGFIAVDKFQRSTSHPRIFAVGDVASRQDTEVPHSGVHAVHAGPIVAENLRCAIEWRDPDRTYSPRPASLYLMSTGNGGAIASYGPFTAQGRWVGRLKRWIDKRWIARYARAASGL